MNPYSPSADPIWHRWVDGLVILVIGFAAGIVITGALMTETVTTTEIIKGSVTAPKIESGVQTTLPPGVKIEES